MNIIYNGVDITSSVQPMDAQLIDYAGGKPDGVSIIFADSEELWSRWKPAKGDTLQVVSDGYDTGLMYIDHLAQMPGAFEIKAQSIPQECRTERSQSWERARFLEIAAELAARYGFTLESYGVENYLYARVDQREAADFDFLTERCALEGYELKVTNNRLVIYAGSALSQLVTIRRNEFIGTYRFEDKSTDIYGGCVVRCGSAIGRYTAPDVKGPELRRNLYAATLTEANRWARGILRSVNKYRVTGRITVTLNTGLAGGSRVQIEDVGLFDGAYIVDRAVHDLIHNQTRLTLRRPLEGYD